MSLLGSTIQVDALGAVVALALTAAGYLVVVEPTLQEAQRQDLARAQTVEATRKSAAAAAQLAEARKRLGQIERELESVAVQLLPPARINQRIDRLTTLAEGHALRLSQMGPEKSIPSKWFTAVPVRMSGEGTYESFRSFLGSVRAEFPDVSVKGLRVGVKGDPTQPTIPAESQKNRLAGMPDAAFEIEFVWYAAPEGSAGAENPANQ